MIGSGIGIAAGAGYYEYYLYDLWRISNLGFRSNFDILEITFINNNIL